MLASIRLAKELGFDPVKVNAVIIRDINDHEIEALAEFARQEDLCFRFIEFMPLDSARAWQKEMVGQWPEKSCGASARGLNSRRSRRIITSSNGRNGGALWKIIGNPRLASSLQ